MTFPQDFLWGAATASYQIEGAALEDGRGECIWTRFSHTPGKVRDGDTGDVACDHYHRYADDVALMQQLGLKAYRLSISWPRVQPQGTGAVNEAGLVFYDRLVDSLLDANIRPFVTLYHWDLPQALQDKGGWENPEIAHWFADYTDLITRRLGDRVKDWITLNEPWVFTFVGYGFGIHAPGIADMAAAYRAAHNALIAHGDSMRVIRQNVPGAQAGITLDIPHFHPATQSDADIAAANRQFAAHAAWFLDPVFKGAYPAEIAEAIQFDKIDGIVHADIHRAQAASDFLGINHYSRFLARHDPDAPPLYVNRVDAPENAEKTAMDWEVYPEGLFNVLTRVNREYAPGAFYVTENGAAYDDPEPDGDTVADPERRDYLYRYFGMAERAIANGVPLKGYFVWSFLDNYEWAQGYSKRFGLVQVNYKTQQRTLKSSARWYKRVIAANALIDPGA